MAQTIPNHATPNRSSRSSGSASRAPAVESPIDLIAIDIDGTLVRTDNNLSSTVCQAVKEVVQAGTRVVLATARPPQEVVDLVQELGINTFQVTFNGALICDGPDNILFHKKIERDVARQIIQTAREIDPAVQVRIDVINAWYTDRGSVSAPANSKRHHLRQGPTGVGPIDEILTGPVTRLVFLTGAVQTLKIRKVLNERYGKQVTLPFCGDRVIMVTHATTNKAEALKQVVQHYGVPRERVMAIGDAPNDIPMLRWSGIGVAMVNAWMPALEAADVLVKSNNHDGVAEAIRKYVFGRYD